MASVALMLPAVPPVESNNPYENSEGRKRRTLFKDGWAVHLLVSHTGSSRYEIIGTHAAPRMTPTDMETQHQRPPPATKEMTPQSRVVRACVRCRKQKLKVSIRRIRRMRRVCDMQVCECVMLNPTRLVTVRCGAALHPVPAF